MNSEVWLRAQYQAVVKERDALQSELELKQKENNDLRKSVFELSYLMSLQSAAGNIFRIGDRLGKSVANQATPNTFSLRQPISSSGSTIEIDGSMPFFRFETELKGHSGAIYCSAFSVSGRWLATGSIDRTIKLWNGCHPYKQTNSFTDHTQLVSDLCWERGVKENRLLSVSFDRTVRLWDTERSVCLNTTRLRAFGALVRVFHSTIGPLSGCAIVACTSPELNVVDPRLASIAHTWSHSCTVTSLLCLPGSSADQVLTGDDRGQLSLFDLRLADKPVCVCVWSHLTTPSELRVSVTDLQLCPEGSVAGNVEGNGTKEFPVLVAAQCSDNSLRLYDLTAPVAAAVAGTALGSENPPGTGAPVVRSGDESSVGGASDLLPPPPQGEGSAVESDHTPALTRPLPRLLQTLRGGHTTGVWRIRCSFYRSRLMDFASATPGGGTLLGDVGGFGAEAGVALVDSAKCLALSQSDIKGPQSQSCDGLNLLALGDGDEIIDDSLVSPGGGDGGGGGGGGGMAQRNPIRRPFEELERRNSRDVEVDGAELTGDPSSRRLRSGTKSASVDVTAAPPRDVSGSVLLATGSTNGQVFVYDVSSAVAASMTCTVDGRNTSVATKESSPVWQRLEGHSGKVYGALFSPMERSLVTFGSEGSLRVWAPQRRRSSSMNES